MGPDAATRAGSVSMAATLHPVGNGYNLFDMQVIALVAAFSVGNTVCDNGLHAG